MEASDASDRACAACGAVGTLREADGVWSCTKCGTTADDIIPEVAEHETGLVGQMVGRVHGISTRTMKKRPKRLVRGVQAVRTSLDAFQVLLRAQSAALVRDIPCSPALGELVGRLFVAVGRALRAEGWGGKDLPLDLHMRGGKRSRDTPRLSMKTSLALHLLAVRYLREPVSSDDLVNMALTGRLPYLGASRVLPFGDELRGRVFSVTSIVKFLSPTLVPPAHRLRALAIRLIERFKHHKLFSTRGMAWGASEDVWMNRIVADVAFPPRLRPFAARTLALLSQRNLVASVRRPLRVAAVLVVVLKLGLGLEGQVSSACGELKQWFDDARRRLDTKNSMVWARWRLRQARVTEGRALTQLLGFCHETVLKKEVHWQPELKPFKDFFDAVAKGSAGPLVQPSTPVVHDKTLVMRRMQLYNDEHRQRMADSELVRQALARDFHVDSPEEFVLARPPKRVKTNHDRREKSMNGGAIERKHPERNFLFFHTAAKGRELAFDPQYGLALKLCAASVLGTPCELHKEVEEVANELLKSMGLFFKTPRLTI